MRRAALLISLVLVSSLVAEASAGPPQAAPRRRSPSKARNVSLGVTLVPVVGGATMIAVQRSEGVEGGAALIMFGSIFGPATGLWYAGNRGGYGLLARTVTAMTLAFGLISYGISEADHYPPGERYGLTLAAAGGAGLLASMIYDIREAGIVAEERNRELRISPTLVPGPGGSLAPGAALSLRF